METKINHLNYGDGFSEEDIKKLADKNSKKREIVEAAENHWKMQYIMALDESTKPYIIEDFKAGAKWQLSQLIEKLEMHILINEDDWNRNPKAQFKDFIKQFNQ